MWLKQQIYLHLYEYIWRCKLCTCKTKRESELERERKKEIERERRLENNRDIVEMLLFRIEWRKKIGKRTSRNVNFTRKTVIQLILNWFLHSVMLKSVCYVRFRTVETSDQFNQCSGFAEVSAQNWTDAVRVTRLRYF